MSGGFSGPSLPGPPVVSRHGSSTRCGVVLAIFTAAPLASAISFTLRSACLFKAFTRRLSQTTACTSKELFLTSPSSSLHREIAIRAGRGEIQAGRARDLRGRRDGLARPRLQRKSQRAVCACHCWRSTSASQLEAPSSRRAVTPAERFPEGLRAPRPPTRRKAVVWSVRRPRPAETRCAADRGLRSRRPCRRPRTAERTPRERPRGNRERRDAERERITAPTPTQT